MQVKKKKAGHLKSLLAQTSCCSYGTRRGREIGELTVHLRKAFSGHIKDKLSHHGSGGGVGGWKVIVTPHTHSHTPPPLPTSCPFSPMY